MSAHLRLAIRTLSKTPFVTAVAVGSIALGIGANAALLGAVALGASLLPALRASRRWWRCATNETRAGSARERRLRPLRAEA